MKPNLSVSSSDLERARETAGRLVDAPSGGAVLPEKPREYVRFNARSLGVSAPPTRPTPPPAPPAPPAPPRPAVAPPQARPASIMEDFELPPEVSAPKFAESKPGVRPLPAPPPPPPAPPTPARTAARPVAPPLPPPPPPPPAPPAPETTHLNEPLLDMEENEALAQAAAEAEAATEEPLGIADDVAAPGSDLADAVKAAESSIDFDEDIAAAAAAAVGYEEPAPEAEPAPSWAHILDDMIYLAHARCALVMNAAGQVHEARGDWPKNTLEKVAARLLRGLEQVPPPPGPDAAQFIEIQLGSFWLTGLRVPLEAQPVVVGFLSQAPVKKEVRPGLEAEVRRGLPL